MQRGVGGIGHGGGALGVAFKEGVRVERCGDFVFGRRCRHRASLGQCQIGGKAGLIIVKACNRHAANLAVFDVLDQRGADIFGRDDGRRQPRLHKLGIGVFSRQVLRARFKHPRDIAGGGRFKRGSDFGARGDQRVERSAHVQTDIT